MKYVTLLILLLYSQAYAIELEVQLGVPSFATENIPNKQLAMPVKIREGTNRTQGKTCLLVANEAVNCGVGTCSDGYKCCSVGVSRFCCPTGTSCDDYDKGQCVDPK